MNICIVTQSKYLYAFEFMANNEDSAPVLTTDNDNTMGILVKKQQIS